MPAKPSRSRRATTFGLAAALAMATLPLPPDGPRAAPRQASRLTPALAKEIRGLQRLAGRPMPELEGRIVIVSFFASWCAPCIDEFAYLGSIYNAYGGEDPVIVAVNLHESWAGNRDAARLRRFIKRTRPLFTVVRGDDRIASAFGDVQQIPSLFMFDRKGRLAYRFLNTPENAISENTEAQLHAALSRLL